MKKSELEKKIKEMGIPPTLYSVNGMYSSNGHFVMGIVLDKMDGRELYHVFSRGDKGSRDYERHFFSEEEACDYMYELLLPVERLLDEKIKSKYREIE